MENDPRYRVGVAGLNQKQLTAKLREAIAAVEKIVPHATVALFVFDKPPGTNMGYIASGEREDVATAVVEWASRVNPRRN